LHPAVDGPAPPRLAPPPPAPGAPHGDCGPDGPASLLGPAQPAPARKTTGRRPPPAPNASCHRLRLQQLDGEAATPLRAFKAQVSSLPFHRLAGHRQSKANSLWLAGDEGLEELPLEANRR